jgi:hypothetical protein
LVAELLVNFGWTAPIEPGGIGGARGMEGMMPFWLRVRCVTDTCNPLQWPA